MESDLNENKCLYCYEKLQIKDLEKEAGKKGFHERCSKKIFGRNNPPVLNFTEDQIAELAEYVIKNQKSVTGVSLLKINSEYHLCRAYDLVSSALILRF